MISFTVWSCRAIPNYRKMKTIEETHDVKITHYSHSSLSISQVVYRLIRQGTLGIMKHERRINCPVCIGVALCIQRRRTRTAWATYSPRGNYIMLQSTNVYREKRWPVGEGWGGAGGVLWYDNYSLGEKRRGVRSAFQGLIVGNLHATWGKESTSCGLKLVWLLFTKRFDRSCKTQFNDVAPHVRYPALIHKPTLFDPVLIAVYMLLGKMNTWLGYFVFSFTRRFSFSVFA